jgi:hypothetical protein
MSKCCPSVFHFLSFLRDLYYKTFYSRNYLRIKLASVLVTLSHLHPSLIFEGKAGAYASGAPYGTIIHAPKY